MSLFSSKKILIFIAISLILGGFYISYTQRQAKQELAAEHDRLLQELAMWEARKDALIEEIERTGDLNYVEVLAREKLQMVKPDEIIYVVYE